MLTLSLSTLRTSLKYDYRPDHVKGLLNSLLCHMMSHDITIGTQQRIKLAKAHVDDFHSVISDIHLHQIIKSNDIVTDWISMVGNQTRAGFKAHSNLGTCSHTTTATVLETSSNDIEHQPTTPTIVETMSNDAFLNMNKTTPHNQGHMICLTIDYLKYPLKDVSCDIHLTTTLPLEEIDETSHDSHVTPHDSQITEDRKKYTETYRQMEFIPYHPLPIAIEEAIFPVYTSRYVEHDDPLWPNKLQCLELVEGASDGLPRFTGTFLTPEARGVRYALLISRYDTFSFS